MVNIKSVIFDMYETLFPNAPESWEGVFRDIVKTQDLAVSSHDLWLIWREKDKAFRRERINLQDPIKSPPFKTYFTAWTDTFVRTFNELDLLGDAYLAATNCIEKMAERRPFYDTLSTLNVLSNDFDLGILSNADNAYALPLIKKYDLPVKCVVTSEIAKAYKPHPDAFRVILEQMGASAQQSLYIGDNPLDDIWGGAMAGLTTVWLNRHNATWDNNLPKPSYEIHNLNQLVTILR